MLSPTIVADTGLGSTGSALVSSFGGIAPVSGPPVIQRLDPAPIPAGALWTALTVRGANFAPGTAVESSELDVQDTTVHSDSWITAHVRAKGGDYSGPGDLSVITPAGVRSNVVSILVLGAMAPVSGGGLPLPVISEPIVQPITIPTGIVPSVPVSGGGLPDVLNVDRPAAPPPPAGVVSAAPAVQRVALAEAAGAAGSTGGTGAPAGTATATAAGTSFPWWLLLLAFLFGKAS